MLDLYENSAIDELRKMAILLRGKFTMNRGMAMMEIDNEHAKGYIATYVILKNLSVRTYNITFSKDFEFSKADSIANPLCFIHCLDGYFMHKFDHENDFTRINSLESTLIKVDKKQRHLVILPENIHLKISVIFISEPALENHPNVELSFLRDSVEELTTFGEDEVPFRYITKGNIYAAPYLELLINAHSTDLTTRLLVQSSILKIIAIKLEKLDRISSGKKVFDKLSSRELNKILIIATAVEKGLSQKITIELLSHEYGLSPAKLQAGFKHLFGKTVNELLRELRMEKARNLIETSDLNISEIAYAVGITNRSYFAKSFYERYKIHPSDYAKQLKLSNDKVFTISYFSHASKSLTNQDIEEMINKARIKNAKNNITGCLVYKNNQFLQIFEGSMGTAIDLFEAIKKDPRHSEVTLINKFWRNSRGFKNWDMAFFSDNFKNKHLIENNEVEYISTSLMNIEKHITEGSEEYWQQLNNLLTTIK